MNWFRWKLHRKFVYTPVSIWLITTSSEKYISQCSKGIYIILPSRVIISAFSRLEKFENMASMSSWVCPTGSMCRKHYKVNEFVHHEVLKDISLKSIVVYPCKTQNFYLFKNSKVYQYSQEAKDCPIFIVWSTFCL